MSALRHLKPPLRALRAAFRAARGAIRPPAPPPPPRHAAPPAAPAVARAEVTITVEETPNPHARKLNASTTVMPSGSLTATSAEAAAGNPVALALLAVPGVRSVFLSRDFATITRDPSTSWAKVEPMAVDAIKRALTA